MKIAEYVDNVRLFLQDMVGYNDLTGGKVETDDSVISLAVNMELSNYNNSDPVLSAYTLENFPAPYELIKGATGRALMSASFRKNRNNLPYNDGGVSVSKDAQGPVYERSALILLQEWKEFITRHKAQRNRDSFTGFYSPLDDSPYYDL